VWHIEYGAVINAHPNTVNKFFFLNHLCDFHCSYRVHTYSTWRVSITNSYTQINNSWHSSLCLPQHVSTRHSVILRGYFLCLLAMTTQEDSLCSVLQSSEKSMGISVCDVRIVFCGQLKDCVEFFKTFKVFKGVFAFMEQVPFWGWHCDALEHVGINKDLNVNCYWFVCTSWLSTCISYVVFYEQVIYCAFWDIILCSFISAHLWLCSQAF
jgi:hypothetical protein